MSAEFRPKGLETWVYVLDENPIPVLAHTADKLRALIGGIDDWSLHDVADIIRQDPIMTVYLIRETQRAFKDRTAGTLTDVHHCVSLLGEDRVLTLVGQFRAMKGDPDDADEVAYQSAIVQSFHAAEQLLAWNLVRRQGSMEKNYLAAQLMGVPTWCLWYNARREMRTIDTLERQERIPREQAERAVLGCTTQEIVLALARRWHFPDVILDALDTERLPSPAFLARVARSAYAAREPKIPNKDERGYIVKTPSFLVALAHWLAHEAGIDWYSRQTRRVIAVLAAYLEQDYHTARLIAQEAALKVSRQFTFPATEMPAARLLFPPRPRLRRRLKTENLPQAVAALIEGKPLDDLLPARPASRQEAPKLKLPMQDEETRIQLGADITRVVRKPGAAPDMAASAGKKAASEQRLAGFVDEEKQQRYKDHLGRLLNEPGAFATEQDVLRASAEVLFDVTHLRRVALFLFDPTRKVLNGYYTLGCEDYPEIRKAVIKLSPPNFFTQLIRKPQGVWVHPERKSDIAALVPGVFKQLVQVDQFFVVSVFNNRRPVAVLHADRGVSNPDGLSENEFKITRSLANATSKYLIERAKSAGKS
ncbi:MAG: HDOD domain-containing protein [Ketobacteraceae bacterium]|nr:HDOD domain-containing protein [Ketobacteraceae bacterium]